MWVEMSEGMCDHANNYYMLKKKGNQKEKYYHKLKTNKQTNKLKNCVCVCVRMVSGSWQPKRQEMFIHIWVYVFKKE